MWPSIYTNRDRHVRGNALRKTKRKGGSFCSTLQEANQGSPQFNVEPKTTKTPKTYNTEDSLVVTDPTTDSALTSLTRGERTGSRIFSWIWSYVIEESERSRM
jgi:hypothetical protein